MSTRDRALLRSALFGLLATACTPDPGTSEVGENTETGEPSGDGDGDPSGDGDGDGELTPTFWQDVAPIYYASCVGCHRDGGIAPFALDDYAPAAAWASASALAVDARVMPPWLIRDDGACNDWQDSPVLDDEAIETILAWVDAGSPEGTPRDDLEVPSSPGLEPGWVFNTPEFTPEPEGGVFSQYDEYRCFLIDPELDHDSYITASEVTPGNEALVHHVLVSIIDPEEIVDGGITNLEQIQALDDESPDRLGWPCFGVVGEGVEFDSIPVTWAPGTGALEFPEGTGAPIPAGDMLVAQVHYNMFDAEVIGQSDSSAVNLHFADEVERPGLLDLPSGLLGTLYEGDPHMIPPGEEDHAFTWSFPVDWYTGWQGAESLELWGLFPHMHEYGTSMSVRLLGPNDEDLGCIGEVPRWDFAWQLYYFLEEPITLESGMRIEVTCHYDTTSAEEPILPGWGTYNEMCLTGLYLVPK